jgi:ribosomal protein S3
MAQKTNPVSLRLKLNRRFDSFWWSSFFYSRLFDRDLLIRKHIRKVFRQTKNRSLGRVGYTGNSKKQKVFIYWAKPNQVEKIEKPSFWRRRRNLTQKAARTSFRSLPVHGKTFLNISSSVSERSLQEKAMLLRLLGLIFSSTLLNPRDGKNTYSKIANVIAEQKAFSSPSGFFSHLQLQKAFDHLKKIKSKKTKVKKRNNDKTLLSKHNGSTEQRGKLIKSINNSFKYGLESHIQQSFQIQSSISPSVLDSPYLSAVTLNDFIEDQLRRRIFFKKVFGTIKRDTQKLFRQGHLKGIRILLSGRLGRPEKAKTASLYIGRTSLNSFNERIDYASSSALTRYGQIGIKVWLSF